MLIAVIWILISPFLGDSQVWIKNHELVVAREVGWVDVGSGYNRKEQRGQERQRFRRLFWLRLVRACAVGPSTCPPELLSWWLMQSSSHPPSAMPSSFYPRTTPSQLPSSSCPAPNSHPLCRFDRPLFPKLTPPLQLPSYSHNFSLLPKSVWIYGVWISTASTSFTPVWTSNLRSTRTYEPTHSTHTKKDYVIPKHTELCVVREM
jgi:hypothetical protein